MSSYQHVPLGEVAEIIRRTIDPSETPGDTTYIGLENIEPGGRLVKLDTVNTSAIYSAKFKFTSADVLFGKLRPYLAKVAVPAVNGVCSTDILPIRPGPNVDRDYLAYFLRLPETVSLATQRATGANLPRLNQKELENFQLPLPDLTQQRRIATILRKAEETAAARRAAIELLETLRTSYFLKKFSSSTYPVVTVSELAAPEKGSIRTGPFGSQLLHGEFVDEGVSVLGIDNVVTNKFRWTSARRITESKYRELKRYQVHAGDLLVTIMGTCGRVAIVPDNISTAINTKHLCCITLDRERCIPAFLHSYFLFHPTSVSYLRRHTKGAIMSGLNMQIIKNLPVSLPPMRDQLEYLRFTKNVDQLDHHQLAHNDELEKLFAALQSRAFQGEL